MSVRALLSNTRHLVLAVQAMLIASIMLYLFWGGLSNLVFRWGQQAEYSHGYLVPLVSIFLLWERKENFQWDFSSQRLPGYVLLLVSMVMLVVGEVSALFVLIHYAFILSVLAIFLLFVGASTKHAAFPIAFLCFSVPLPYFIEIIFTANLQLISSNVGVYFIRLAGIPVYLNGNIIDLGEYKLHVVEACAGLRYLFPLVSIGVLVAYYYRAHWWLRGIIVASTVPITVLMNSFRIGVTGFLTDRYGISAAQGFLHDFEGWVVFLLCLIILLAEIYVIERLVRGREFRQAFAPPAQAVSHDHNKKSVSYFPGIAIALILSMAAGIQGYISQRSLPELKITSLHTFPMNLDEWVGMRSPMAPDLIAGLGLSEYVLADFKKRDAQVNLYVAYYAEQKKGISPHSPKVCIPGGGWEIRKFSREKNGDMPFNRVLIQNGEHQQLVYYWFVERGQVVANEYMKKWLLFKDALFSRRSDGSLVRIATSVDVSEEEADRHLMHFLKSANPRILGYLPGRLDD